MKDSKITFSVGQIFRPGKNSLWAKRLVNAHSAPNHSHQLGAASSGTLNNGVGTLGSSNINGWYGASGSSIHISPNTAVNFNNVHDSDERSEEQIEPGFKIIYIHNEGELNQSILCMNLQTNNAFLKHIFELHMLLSNEKIVLDVAETLKESRNGVKNENKTTET